MKILRFLWNLFWDGPLYICKKKESSVIHREHRFSNTYIKNDEEAIASDWKKVGEDMRTAMDEYNGSIAEYTGSVCEYMNDSVQEYEDVINNDQPKR